MARLKGIEIPNNKQIFVSLTYIYGINISTSKKILSKLNIDIFKKVKDLSEKELTALNHELNNYIIEGDLKKEVLLNIKNLIEIRSYRGSRHKKGLPVRGQSSHQNAKTVKKLSSRNRK